VEPQDRPHTLRSIEPPGGDSLVGTVIHERYRILGRLGAGGMGIVYRGEHEVLKTPLAVKVLHPYAVGDGESMERLRREAQAASAIGNEHIVEVRDFGQLEDGSRYIVMELIEGRDLYSIVHEGPLGWERVRDIGLQLSEALDVAHERGIVHRDLKLENVLLTERRGRRDFAKLVDFGIAKVQGHAKITAAGRLMGTPEYMSPEQCAARPVDHRTDIYSFGVLLYEMVTGRLPFQHAELGVLLRMHIHDPPSAPSAVAPEQDIPLGLEAVILRCLAKNPAARFQTMADVGEALRQVEDPSSVAFDDDSALDVASPSRPELSIVVGGPESVSATAARPSRRVPAWALGGGAALTLAVGLGVWLGTRPGGEPISARAESGNVAEGAGSSVTAPRETPVSPEPEPEPEPAPTAAVQPLEPPSPPATPALSPEIVLHTVPEGAEVLDEGGALLGVTPFRLPRPEEGQRIALQLRLEGHVPYPVQVSPLSAQELTVPLARRETRRVRSPAQAAPASSAPTPSRAAPAGSPEPRREFLDPWLRP
jgi:serine/threonine protein kinase